MAIILKKHIHDVSPQRAVTFKYELPKEDNEINDARYVKSEHTFFIFNGFAWQELDLVIE